MKIRLSLYALLVTFLSVQTVVEAQTMGMGCNPEIQRMVRSLSQLASQSNCQGTFIVKERWGKDKRSGMDVAFSDVSYALKGRTLFSQTFKSSIDTYVTITPIKISGCSALFLTYSEGAAGRFNNSYLVFQSGNRFSCLDLAGAYGGGYSAEDLDNDGEFEIVGTERQGSSCTGVCEGCYPMWGRIFHLDRQTRKLIEMNGEQYPKYYASLAENLRNGYESIKNDRYVSAGCKQTFLQLIRRAERLAQGRR
jgi:hypothetical protein